jgi:hypothetical protein
MAWSSTALEPVLSLNTICVIRRRYHGHWLDGPKDGRPAEIDGDTAKGEKGDRIGSGGAALTTVIVSVVLLGFGCGTGSSSSNPTSG